MLGAIPASRLSMNHFLGPRGRFLIPVKSRQRSVLFWTVAFLLANFTLVCYYIACTRPDKKAVRHVITHVAEVPKTNGGCSSVRLERQVVALEAVGSSPITHPIL